MDNDNIGRERALRRILKVHGDKTRQQIIDLADDIGGKITDIEDEIRALQKVRRGLDDEHSDLLLLLQAYPSEIEAARRSEDQR